MHLDSHRTKHMVAWFAVPFVAIANGALREMTYGRMLPKDLSHNLSLAPLMVGIFAFAYLIGQRWPLPSRRAGVQVGVVWLTLTVAFEFGMGAVTGVSAEDVLAQYNVLRGHLWPLAPLSMAIAPESIRRIQQRRQNRRLAPTVA
jgi:hypothetical protein